MIKFMDCMKFANENPVARFATNDEDQPRVRALAMRFADEKGLFTFTPDHPDLVIFRILKGGAFFWNFETNLEPKKADQLWKLKFPRIKRVYL
jgi:hypothetical protein